MDEPEDYREQRELDKGFVERPTADDLADMKELQAEINRRNRVDAIRSMD